MLMCFTRVGVQWSCWW